MILQQNKTYWQEELTHNITTAGEIKNYLRLTDEETEKISKIIERFPMSVTRYYLSLINPEDKNDPIRRMCIPNAQETNMDGVFDTSGECENTKAEGLQHKYAQTALVLSTNVCAMYCRHCFRKRLVGLSDGETVKMFDNVCEYISDNERINNVLVSGGDAFLNSNKMIEYYLDRLTQIDHLSMIRFGTRTPVVFPQRISGDPVLLEILEKYNQKKQICIVTHFNHPTELTEQAHDAISKLQKIGIPISNQTVLLKGVNDDEQTLANLMNKLVSFGIMPYYLFQCRPVSGVKAQFQVPFSRACGIVDRAKSMMNGHAKRFRYAMSHVTGKIEILGMTSADEALFKYHQSKEPKNNARIFKKKITADQCWLDDTESD